jgi:hypothetical protein
MTTATEDFAASRDSGSLLPLTASPGGRLPTILDDYQKIAENAFIYDSAIKTFRPYVPTAPLESFLLLLDYQQMNIHTVSYIRRDDPGD